MVEDKRDSATLNCLPEQQWESSESKEPKRDRPLHAPRCYNLAIAEDRVERTHLAHLLHRTRGRVHPRGDFLGSLRSQLCDKGRAAPRLEQAFQPLGMLNSHLRRRDDT